MRKPRWILALVAGLTLTGAALADVAIPKPAAAQGTKVGKPDDKGKPDGKPGAVPGSPPDGKPGTVAGSPDGAGTATAVPPASAGTATGSPPGGPDDADKKARQEKRAAARAERKSKSKEERTAERAKVQAELKGKPMAAAYREELKRHARRLARLDRIKDVAEDEKDTATVERVGKLLAKENARHQKWMENFRAKAADKGGEK